MKFFKQTKETKRKMSFFLALAMVISLLPVSPVAKAADKADVKIDVYSNIKDTKVTSVKSGSVTGSAVITLESSVDGQTISSASITAVKVLKAGDTSTKSAVSSLTGQSIAVTADAVAKQPDSDLAHDEDIKNGILEVTVTGIVTGTAILLEGSVVLKEGTTPTEAPTATPTGTAVATATPTGTAVATTTPTETPAGTGTPAPTPGSDATATPVPKFEVTVEDDGFNYADIKLEIAGASTSQAVSVEKGKTVTLTITPINKSANAKVILPTLTVNDNAKNWETDGDSYKAVVTIEAKTTIVVTGGKIAIVNASSSVAETTPAPEVKDQTGIENVTIDDDVEELKTNFKNAAVENATEDNVTINGIKVTKAQYDEFITALSDSNTQITTALNVATVVTSDAIAEAETAANAKVETFSGNTEETKKFEAAFGKNDNAIKETVKEVIKSGNAVPLDITLTSIVKYAGGTTEAAIAVSKVSTAIQITMDMPTALKGKDTTTGSYFVIRVHNGEVTVLPCTVDGDKISFKSDSFSTYFISFVENKPETPTTSSSPEPSPSVSPSTAPSPSPTGSGSGNNGNGGGIGGYVPSNSATPTPSAAPSASPSADASAAPSVTPDTTGTATPSGSANPSDPSNGDNTTPTNTPDTTKAPGTNGGDGDTGSTGSTSVKVGKKATISGSQYKVTSVTGTRTVQFTKAKKNAKSVVIPSTVKVSGKNYKVTTIAKNAFKGNKKLTKVTIGANVKKIGATAFKGCSKLKSITIKTTKLTAKKVGKNAFKGINSKATITVPKAKVKAYKKIIKAKGAGKNVKVKK